ncbi:Glycosyltransferase 8 domain-containing protein 2,Glycosyltransferase 8 domain-containing protein 1 [Mytilus edulis]|uniref:Glycosyltransferase 8 domain-containing protein 2,Glycosyltransferase 8 domain-containing protein 1 n=1 Tax=Mytilus edulis TaxID=6550 RepID=A0A8S3UDD7_MYTED|nr:Glycosyltransferase 8 domain-containing protein 2,Glycosyltransferase 8 domain-containing protein 1 [Mytilus edulis]
MVVIWFPELLPHLKSRRNIDKGIYRQEADDYKSNSSLHKDAVHLCITSDKNTIGGMIALINSIYSNTKHHVFFHLVVDAESQDHLRIWIETTKLKDIHYQIKVFPENWLNYARYYLPKLFPDIKGRVLFIDDDSIVQGDIKELYDMDLSPGHAVGFSSECSSASRRLTLMKNNYADYIDFKSKNIKEMKIDPTECAFNTGVFIADLDLWRKYNITNQLQHWMELNTKEEIYGNERGGGGSQPPMMIVFYKKYTNIDPGWHVRYLGWTSGTSYTKQFIGMAKLLHWNGRFKPWGRVSQHKDVWNKYYIEDPTGKFKPARKN